MHTEARTTRMRRLKRRIAAQRLRRFNGVAESPRLFGSDWTIEEQGTDLGAVTLICSRLNFAPENQGQSSPVEWRPVSSIVPHDVWGLVLTEVPDKGPCHLPSLRG